MSGFSAKQIVNFAAEVIAVVVARLLPPGGSAGQVLLKSSAADYAFTWGFSAPRVQSVTSVSTVTPNADADDLVVITAQAAGLTIANPSGTPTQGMGLIIRVKDNGTARTIGFGTQYRAIGTTLPTTTVISKTLYISCIYNSTETKWDVVGVAQQA